MQVKSFILIFLLLNVLCSCVFENGSGTEGALVDTIQTRTADTSVALTNAELMVGLFTEHPKFIARGFDFPVGKPNAKGYYNAQGFGETNHLGDDWNAVTGGNSDLGDPIYAVANGYVNFAQDIGGGWGNVIRVWHRTTDGTNVESLYAHCDTILVDAGDFIGKGQQIGTIGDAHGNYLAHLHLEIRTDIELPVGGGYANDKTGYVDPTAFINAHR